MNDMAVILPGDAVTDLMKNATNRVVIVAPYIKLRAIRRLLKILPETIYELVCVTRWLPEDIVAGVCDLEIFDEVTQIKGGRLLVHPHLHAKYYSNGQKTLVGSANMTSRGLGWHTPANVELLVALPAEFPGLSEWESSLLDSAVEVTEQLREQIRLQADHFKQSGLSYHTPEVEDETGQDEQIPLWVPKFPNPEWLWEVYCGHGSADTMVSSSFEAAQDDLAALALPRGLSKDLFTAYVAGILQQMPLFLEIDKLSSTGLTDTKAHEFLSEYLISGNTEYISEYDHIWHIIKLWLTFFFPESYRLETGQEVLVKGKEISTF